MNDEVISMYSFIKEPAEEAFVDSNVDTYMNDLGVQDDDLRNIDYQQTGRYVPGTANIKALMLYYGKFKPRYDVLKKQLRRVKTKKDRLAILFEQKKLILETRAEIIKIPESTIVNILFTTAMIVIGVAIFLDCVGEIQLFTTTVQRPTTVLLGNKIVHGTVPEKAYGLTQALWKSGTISFDQAELVGWAGLLMIFYQLIKSLVLVIKYPEAATLATGHKHSGVLSKQICVGHLNKFANKVDRQIAKVSAIVDNTPVPIPEKSIEEVEKKSNAGFAKLEQLLSAIKAKFA